MAEQAGVEAGKEGHAFFHLLRFLWQRMHRDHLSVMAGHLAYVSLLSLVPLISVVFAVFSVIPQFETVRQQLELFVFTNFVPAAGEQIHGHLSRLVANASALTSIGIAALFVVALLQLSAIDQHLNHIWRSQRRRHWLLTLLLYWLLLVFGPLMAGGSILLSSYLLSLRLLHQVQLFDSAAGVALGALPGLFSFCGALLLFLSLPNRRGHLKPALLGAACAALLLELAKKGFAFYISRFTSYEAIYGALAGIPILFVWVYVSWWILLFGAEIGAGLESFWLRKQALGAAHRAGSTLHN